MIFASAGQRRVWWCTQEDLDLSEFISGMLKTSFQDMCIDFGIIHIHDDCELVASVNEFDSGIDKLIYISTSS